MQDKNYQSIAIFAGRGYMPQILIDDCIKKNRQFLIFLLNGENYEIDYSIYNPVKISYGEVERFFETLKNHNIKNIVFIGGVTKPNFSSIKVDKQGAILLAKIIANKILGDDAVIRTVIKYFEKQGLKIIPIDQILDCVFSKKEVVSSTFPSNEQLIDIELGIKASKYFSRFDVGQSLIVAQKQIIAIEAIEGTDQMIKRCKSLNEKFIDKAILIKLKKTNQTKKADLPTIGIDTIYNCIESNIKGIVIQANSTLVIDKEQIIKIVNDHKLFLKII
jgi:DUF1009 family protein